MASTKPHLLPARPGPRRWSASQLVEPYCRLTLAFVIGLYLPWAATAPDLLRHFAEALHSWTILFFAPVAAYRLLVGAVARSGPPGRVARHRA
jgi:hypothetical protein